jgi:NAD(P)-dependent dehydrogenase (short-subunit alcohol dehydrogenase family)
LAAQGLQVLLASRELQSGIVAAQSLSEEVTAVALDLSERERLKSQMLGILEQYPQIDVLVNNAGILEEGPLLEITDKAFDDSMRVNVHAPLELMQLLVPRMIQRGYGRIVNVSSGWGSFREGLDGPAAYCVSKAALNALTVSLAKDLPKTVKVNAMCPGWVRTRMGGDMAPRTPEQGADTALWLATLPDTGPSGGFFRDRQPIEW